MSCHEFLSHRPKSIELATPVTSPLYLNSTSHVSPHPPHLPHTLLPHRLRCRSTNTPASSPLVSCQSPSCPAAHMANHNHGDTPFPSSQQTQSHQSRPTNALARSWSFPTHSHPLARLIRLPRGASSVIVLSRMFFAYSVPPYRLSSSDCAMLDFL